LALDVSPITDDQLTVVCAPCVKAMFDAFMQFSTDSSAVSSSLWISMICVKDLGPTDSTSDDRFCWPVAEAEFNYVDPDSNTLTDQEIEMLCDPCVRAEIVALLNIQDYFGAGDNPIDPTILATIDFLCTLDTDGNICLEVFIDQTTIVSTNANCPSFATDPVPATCSPACIADLQTLVSTMGCCAALIPDYLGLASADSGNNPLMADFYDQTCLGSPNYDSCGDASVQGQVTIDNFVYAWYFLHKDDTDPNIILDLSLTTGAASDSITLDNVTESADGTVTVHYTIAVTSNAEASVVSSTAGGSVSFPLTNQNVPLSSSSDPQPRQAFTMGLSASNSMVTASYATYTPPGGDGGTGSGAGRCGLAVMAALAPAAAYILA